MNAKEAAVSEFLRKCPVIAILRRVPRERFAATVKAIYDGGVRMMEVTFDQTGAVPPEVTAEEISFLARSYAGRVLPGAGTVIAPPFADLAAESGAAYVISPDGNREVIRRTKQLGLVSMPGAFTPTEVMQAHSAGADYVKIFPAGLLGPGYIRSIRAPLPGIRLLAVGGVNAENACEFLQAGCVGLGVGNEIADAKLIEAGDYAAITRRAAAFCGGKAGIK